MSLEAGSAEHIQEVRAFNRRCRWVIAIFSFSAIGVLAYLRYGPQLRSEDALILLVSAFCIAVIITLGALLSLLGAQFELWASLRLKKILDERKSDAKHP